MTDERSYMFAVFNRLPVKEGMAGQVVERFANSRGSRASSRWKFCAPKWRTRS